VRTLYEALTGVAAVIPVALVAAGVSFTLSSAAGLGGSLILVPALATLLGTKEGVALAALLLGLNNVWKVFAYRKTLPLRKASILIAATVLGALIGAYALVRVEEPYVSVAVLISFGVAFAFERRKLTHAQTFGTAPAFALGSGATSGFTGTSGPLKGLAIRSLQFDRFHLVGAASLVSLANDAAKSVVFLEGSLVTNQSFIILMLAIPIMPAGTFLGKYLNTQIGERLFTVLFWGVMIGYAARIIAVLGPK